MEDSEPLKAEWTNLVSSSLVYYPTSNPFVLSILHKCIVSFSKCYKKKNLPALITSLNLIFLRVPLHTELLLLSPINLSYVYVIIKTKNLEGKKSVLPMYLPVLTVLWTTERWSTSFTINPVKCYEPRVGLTLFIALCSADNSPFFSCWVSWNRE